MNYHLFLDNFRGFSNTYIPITDVNFLVGENSTGKTSIMGLIRLLSSPRFFFNQEFADEHVNFGHFSDIVSAHSADRSFFRLGFIREDTFRKNRKRIATGWLLTYIEDQGLPRLSTYTFCRGTTKISVRTGKTLSYKIEKSATPPSGRDIISTLLPQWVNEHSSGPNGYQKFDIPGGVPSNLPLFLALSLIRSHPMGLGDKRNKPRKGSVSFTFDAPDVSFSFLPEVTWVAPIRTKPRRTYDELTLDYSPEGTHTPYLIRKILHSKSDAASFKAFIENAGRISGLFQDVRIKNFGREATAPFELDIVLDDKALNLTTVGYGVSQALPVLVEIMARPRGTWFAIQQPEVHLHPRAQAALGDVLFEMAITEHKNFLIETHSDFTIDRFRMNYEKGKSAKPDSQILFFERRDKRNIVTPLRIGQSGELPANQPDAYREFFIREEMRLLGI